MKKLIIVLGVIYYLFVIDFMIRMKYQMEQFIEKSGVIDLLFYYVYGFSVLFLILLILSFYLALKKGAQ